MPDRGRHDPGHRRLLDPARADLRRHRRRPLGYRERYRLRARRDRDGDSVSASLTLDSNDANRLDPASEEQVLFLNQPYPNHNGGDLLFGPDGYLYAFFGDGGSGGDPHDNGQNRDALLGKVLRLDIDHPSGGRAYSAPAGNPFLGGAGRDEIWLFGLRNPWRASFDRATGDLWIGDVGQNAWEEVDVARAGVGG